MVPNGSAYNNYPPFGTNGTKTPPGGSTESAKYALGMVPADTFPAEWANFLFYGATQGITRLNQDTGSIKKEINSVLSNFNITPDAQVNNQLLEALNKLKAEAALAAHPVGSLYWTSSNENPATTFGGGTWVQIKDKFILSAGDTYTNGATGGSATVTLTTNNLPSHSHNFTPVGTVSSHTHGLNNHTHSVGAHSHGLNEHTHSFSGSGSQAHTHKVLSIIPGGVKTCVSLPDINSNGFGFCSTQDTSRDYYQYCSKDSSNSLIQSSPVTITIVGTTGKASGNTANSTAFNTGTASGNTTSVQPTFSGTAGTTSATGSGAAFSILPPYIVKYCWERTA